MCKEVNALRTYEALYIVKPDKNDDEIQTIAKDVESLVTTNGGTIVGSEIWGKRKLAYEVKKQTEGVYVLLRFESPPDFVTRLENHFRLSDDVIRDLVVDFEQAYERVHRIKPYIIRPAKNPGSAGCASRGTGASG